MAAEAGIVGFEGNRFAKTLFRFRLLILRQLGAPVFQPVVPQICQGQVVVT